MHAANRKAIATTRRPHYFLLSCVNLAALALVRCYSIRLPGGQLAERATVDNELSRVQWICGASDLSLKRLMHYVAIRTHNL